MTNVQLGELPNTPPSAILFFQTGTVTIFLSVHQHLQKKQEALGTEGLGSPCMTFHVSAAVCRQLHTSMEHCTSHQQREQNSFAQRISFSITCVCRCDIHCLA